jgi:hypothetical protein
VPSREGKPVEQDADGSAGRLIFRTGAAGEILSPRYAERE